MMALLDLFKYELGQRNVKRFFTGTTQEIDDVLNGYLDAGREALARKKPIVKTVDVTIENASTVALPPILLWPKKLWLDGVLLNEMVTYPRDKHEHASWAFTPFEPVDGPYPDSNETEVIGNWRYDEIRKALSFDQPRTGTLTIGGFGIPNHDALSEMERSSIVTFSLSKAYEGIIAKLIAKPDLILPGFQIKQHLSEMQLEARRLKEQFNADENRPYGLMSRS